MAFTLEQIAGYLDNIGMTYKYEKDEERIVSGMSDDQANTLMIFIRAKEDGNIFELQAEPLDDNKKPLDVAKDHKYLCVLLPQLLYYNYMTKFGTWEYDPSDGDLRFAIEIPLEDATMTEGQFRRIMSMMETSLEQVANIKHILKTGQIPEDEIAKEFEATLMGAFAKFLEEQKKSGGSSGSSDGI